MRKNKSKKSETIEIAGKKKIIARILDQRALPHRLCFKTLKSFPDAVRAIREMEVRGAPLIGVTAAVGMALAAQNAPENSRGFRVTLEKAARSLKAARPTAVNLAWAVDRQLAVFKQGGTVPEIRRRLVENARLIKDEDENHCRWIGVHGLKIIRQLARLKKSKPVQIMTHCNAGRLAAVDWGTATAPVYAAHAAGIPVHVWVSETRPRNQGASLTAWELAEAGIPHTLVVDNACGHLMQEGLVDMVIVGCDRMARNGDAANKIGTYLKALGAKAQKIPFYVALPSSTIDRSLTRGVGKITIEDRGAEEVVRIAGALPGGRKAVPIQLARHGTPAKNPGFDVTPASLISGIITERGVCRPHQLKKMFCI